MAQAAVIGFGEKGPGAAPWQRAHDELVRLAATRAGLDYEEGRWLLRAERAGAHLRLGYASFREYAERLFGYSPRLVQEKLRVATALEELPLLSAELEHGGLSFSAVRELSRVATTGTEREWLEAARGRSIRELEELVSGHLPGSLPGDLPDPGVRRHVLRLEVSGDVLATFREAMAKVRREAGEPLDDDAAVLLLCRQALAGPRDEGRSSYQVALTVCEHCRRGMQQGRGELVEVPVEVVEMAACDGQDVGHVERAHVSASSEGSNTGARNKNVHASAGNHSANVGAGDHSACNEDVHVGASHGSASLARAKQTIPPALRRRVTRRDGGRCQVPGCRHAVFTDVHHLRARSEGGENRLENLVTLCSAHHRAIHRGELVIAGTPSERLVFRHADGTPYGAFLAPSRAELGAKAQRALMQLGYRETEARGALAQVPTRSDESLERLVRLALSELASGFGSGERRG
jgi:hypothetical protein